MLREPPDGWALDDRRTTNLIRPSHRRATPSCEGDRVYAGPGTGLQPLSGTRAGAASSAATSPMPAATESRPAP